MHGMSDFGLKRNDSARDDARLLLAVSRERFSAAAAELLLPDHARLTEWQRHTASALLDRLVGSIEEALRASLAPRFETYPALHAALTSAQVPIALPLLERAQVLRDAGLGTVLVRRVEEHRYWRENGGAGGDLLTELLRDGDEGIAADAAALIMARSRRFDRYQEPLLGHTDLPADLQHRLVWLVAAALRQYMIQQQAIPAGAADGAISTAAARMIAEYDEGQTMEACSVRLAQRLRAAGRLEGEDLGRLLEQGMLPLFVAGIALRCGLDHGPAWDMLSDPLGRGPALLLRAAGLGRTDAATILLALNSKGRLFSGLEGEAAAQQLDLFDATSEDMAADTMRLWQADPGYRAAVARLSTRRPVAS